MRRRALLFALTLVWMAIWVPPAYAAFRLERADGSKPTKGISLGSSNYPARVSVFDAPAPTPKPRVVASPTRLPKVSGGKCYWEPGTPPQAVLDREIKGADYDPTAYNFQGSGASGCWQFMPGTWGGYKGYANAADAPVEVQNERAKQVWAGGDGCSHWAAC